MPKLSPTQQHVVDRMREGWQLVAESVWRYSSGGDTVVTLRFAGLPYRERVRYATFEHLLGHGYIVWMARDDHGATYYTLSEEV